MCPINFVFMSCKVKKQESPEYYSVVNSKTIRSHLKSKVQSILKKYLKYKVKVKVLLSVACIGVGLLQWINIQNNIQYFMA
jgi:hypothetical protein